MTTTSLTGNDIQSPLKKVSFFYKHRFVFVSFIVPLVLMIHAFYRADFFPFGENQIMVIDSWHQYFPFLRIFHENLQTGGSMFWSWQGSGGTNFLALLAYYGASPLNLLTIFFPVRYLTEAMALITILKIALAGAFMHIFLRWLTKKDDLGIVSLSILYALSAYAMGYYWCLMWLDVMALLPLCILGLNLLINEGKFRLYTISLALIMFTNFYIGVMACIFIALYYPVIYFGKNERRGAKHCAVTTGKALGFSLLGCLMAAVILIPTYLNLQNTYYVGQNAPVGNNFYHNLIEIVTNLMPNVNLTVRGGLPNIYAGVLSTILAILFLTCKKIAPRKKVLYSLLLGVLILSFNWNQLDFIWHGFNFPNELPHRFSFVFSFVLVVMAAQAYKHLSDITPKQIGVTAAGGIAFVIFAEQLLEETMLYRVVYIALLLIVLYSLILGLYKTGRFKQAVCGVMLFLVVFGEMTNYTTQSVVAVGHSNKTTYFTHFDEIRELVDTVTEENDGDFFRTEIFNHFTVNDPALYGFNGLTQFSSKINTHVPVAMRGLGLPSDPGSNSFMYMMNTPIVNYLLNVRYIIGRGSSITPDPFFERAHTRAQSHIYRNTNSSSVAFMVNEEIRDWSSTIEAQTAFAVQNDFVWRATGIETPALAPAATLNTNDTVGAIIGYGDSISAAGEGSNATLVFDVETAGPLYAFVQARGASTISAQLGENRAAAPKNNRGSLVSLGDAVVGDRVTIEIVFEEGQGSEIQALIYGLDTEVWESAYEHLSAAQIQVTSWNDTRIDGRITVEDDGVLMTSIPYESGWRAYVNGERAQVVPVSNYAWVSIDLPAGEYELSFRYTPAGFVPGLLITLGSTGLLIALHFIVKRIRTRKKKIAMIESDELSEEQLELKKDIQSIVEESFSVNEYGDYVI